MARWGGVLDFAQSVFEPRDSRSVVRNIELVYFFRMGVWSFIHYKCILLKFPSVAEYFLKQIPLFLDNKNKF